MPDALLIAKTSAAIADVCEELDEATRKYGPFASAHEGHSIIEEEFEELWDEIKTKQSTPGRTERMRAEAIQLAAMALRFVIDLT